MYSDKYIKLEASTRSCNWLSKPPPWHSSQGHPSCQAAAHASCQKLCRANMIYSRAERVLILEYYFTVKLFPAVREAFSNANPDKKISNMATIHRQ
jgi:hypothetical protein